MSAEGQMPRSCDVPGPRRGASASHDAQRGIHTTADRRADQRPPGRRPLALRPLDPVRPGRPPPPPPHPRLPVRRTGTDGAGRPTGAPYPGAMLVGRTGLSPVMVGRGTDLDRLAGLMAARPEPSVALVAGEAGIGKTRLVQELVRRVPDGTLVLAGQADPGTVGRPLELLLDAVGPALAAAAEDGAEGARDALVAAVRDADRPAEERIRAGVDLVRRLTAGRPGLVVFEDLHWADPESVAVFERLAEPDDPTRAPGTSLVLLGTYRPDGLSRRHPAA